MGLAGDRSDRTVLLLATPETSLERRGRHPSLRRWAQWYDLDFLRRLDDFYRVQAPTLCSGELVVIDTDDLTTHEVAEALLRQLHVELFDDAVAGRLSVLDVAPAFRGAYDRLGGAAVFGRPVTRLLDGCRKVQLFELGALELDGAGKPRVWNVGDAQRDLLRWAPRPLGAGG